MSAVLLVEVGRQPVRPRTGPAAGRPAVSSRTLHADVRRWRKKTALARTLERRPDLLTDAALDDEDRVLLDEIRKERRRASNERD
jgi:tRNA (guanine37-N1)-methyltransferase